MRPQFQKYSIKNCHCRGTLGASKLKITNANVTLTSLSYKVIVQTKDPTVTTECLLLDDVKCENKLLTDGWTLRVRLYTPWSPTFLGKS